MISFMDNKCRFCSRQLFLTYQAANINLFDILFPQFDRLVIVKTDEGNDFALYKNNQVYVVGYKDVWFPKFEAQW